MLCKVYSAAEHQLNLEDIDPDALYVMEKLQASGHTAYLVGGGVRDLLLGHKPKDFDISTSAKPEEIKKIFRNCLLIGRRFRLAHIRFGKKVIEVATFRSGDNANDSLILRDNEWGNPEEDVLRRDFTINGLFYDPSRQEIIDYVGGYLDAQKRYLQTIGKAYIRFKQDPVRMIRLLKFQARFNLDIDQDSKVALLECRGELLKSSQARILEEILRMMESGAAAPFFRLMNEYGFLDTLTPALSAFLETPDGGEIYNLFQEVDNNLREYSEALPRTVLLSALVFPILQHKIRVHYLDREKIPHLGEIQNLCEHIFDEVFRPFFLVPKRLKIIATFILTSQYRLTPLEKKSFKRWKVPNSIDFPLAIQFLQLRAWLDPALQTTVDTWKKAVQRKHASHRKPRSRTEDSPTPEEAHEN